MAPESWMSFLNSAVAVSSRSTSPCCSTKPSRASLMAGAMTWSRFIVPYFFSAISMPDTVPGTATARWPLELRSGMTLPSLSRYMSAVAARGHLAVAIPGTVSGMEMALKKYGTMKRDQVIAPAIKLARDGFVLQQGDVDLLETATAEFKKDIHDSGAIFLNKGEPMKVGEKLVQKDLAKTLKEISDKGTDGFYKGWVAKAIVDSSQAGKGLITQADLDKYQTRELAPIECDYRGYHVVSAPPPSSGGVVICEIMNILEGYPMPSLGYRSAQGMQYQIEAMRHAYVDRNSYLGDPDFVKNPVAHLLDKEYAAKLRAAIDPQKAGISREIKPGVAPHEGNNTTHYSIVDKWGNAVSVTYTLNDWFGAGVMASKTGVILNDEMDDFTSKIGVPNMYGTPILEVKSSISSLRMTPVLLAMTPAPNQSLRV